MFILIYIFIIFISKIILIICLEASKKILYDEEFFCSFNRYFLVIKAYPVE